VKPNQWNTITCQGFDKDEIAEVKFISGNVRQGRNKFFKTLAKLASSSVFLLAKSENNRPKT
jgi:hypothetical protein